ncbi:MAG: OmpA family protein, partial [Gammaproteobacteria bacterium]
LLAGCASTPPEVPRDRVVLLPGADGRTGRLAVTAGAGSTVLDQAYGTASVSSAGNVARGTGDAAAIRREFGTVLSALPPRPVAHTLYFESGTEQLAADSETTARAILLEIAGRPVADIVVIGHTDTAGESSFNDTLSVRRAESVRARLIELGGAAGRIKATGRGERELAVPTPDEVHEPRNRRVELIVR